MYFKMLSAIRLNLDQSKILTSGNALIPKNKSLDKSKLKGNPRNKESMAEEVGFVLERVENIVIKYFSHFNPFPNDKF